MTTPVFNLNDFIESQSEGYGYSGLAVPLGNGYEIRGSKDQPFSGADGLGGVTSHYNIRTFQLQMNMMDYANGDTSKAINILIALLEACKGTTNPFYFYSPREAASVDLTGAATTGRYLVRFVNTAQIEWFAPLRHRGQLSLQEVRA